MLACVYMVAVSIKQCTRVQMGMDISHPYWRPLPLQWLDVKCMRPSNIGCETPEYQRVDDASRAGLQSPRVIEGVTMWSARKTLGLARNALSVPEDQVRHAKGDLLPGLCKALTRIAMCPCHVVSGALPTVLP